jgi:glycosyltransferase involved in cell wall biosynthesis
LPRPENSWRYDGDGEIDDNCKEQYRQCVACEPSAGPVVMSTTMRVLSVIHYPIAGGPHNRNRRIAPLLQEQGIELVALLTNDCTAIDAFSAAGVGVVTLPLTRLRATVQPREHVRTARAFWRDVSDILRLIDRESIDVVLINGLVNPQAGLSARKAGVPVVWQLLDSRTPKWANRMYMPVVRSLADVVMTTGMAVAREHPGAMSFGERLIPFFPPVDLGIFGPVDEEARARARAALGISQDTFLVGTVGNLNSQKGHEFTLRAVADLRSAGLAVDVRLLGTSASAQDGYEHLLREEATALRLTTSTIVDPKGRVAELLPAFDVFVLASRRRSEGIPTSVLEALACGVPVVASDVGSITEILEHGVTGLVVTPEDVPALTHALVTLHEQPQLRAKLTREGLRKAQLFDVRECAAKHAMAFDLAVKHHRQKGRHSARARDAEAQGDHFASP